MNKFLLKAVTNIIAFVLLHTSAVFAQFEEGKKTVEVIPIMGTSIIPNPSSTSNVITYSPSAEIDRKTIGIIRLKINEQSNLFIPGSFAAYIKFSHDYTASIGGPIINDTFTLKVNYNSQQGTYNNVNDYKVLKNIYYSKITITDTSFNRFGKNFDPRLFLVVENELSSIKYYTFSNTTSNVQPTNVNAYVTALADTDSISWQIGNNANENLCQLEWAWLEDNLLPFYINNGVTNYQEIFSDNGVTVDIDYNPTHFYNYKIPTIYGDTGRIYYRVRACYRKADGTILNGVWSNFGANFSIPFNGHQDSLNWQRSTSFAENGKQKTVIQYFDGTLRPRQTVTKDNSTGNTVVAETIYDLQGRANIQILPTPNINQNMQFFKNFNVFQGMKPNENPARYFDLTPAVAKCNGSVALNDSFGNGRYYSWNNDWLANEKNAQYIPNANGFAFTETRFTSDATQRVESQGGVGSVHQIGTGKETKYYYGKPAQQELDALFGTEAGYSSYYQKNMVLDANGQMSVSYIDMQGRTVATALAGDAPTNVDSIYGNTYYPLASGAIKNNLITPLNNIVNGRTIESVNTILVPAANTNYEFTYQLNPAILSLNNCNGIPICYDCKYDLEITIQKEGCTTDPIIVKKYSNLQQVPTAQSCTTSHGFIGTNITAPTKTIQFNHTLSQGSYIVRKTLTINDSIYNTRRDSALKQFLCKTQEQIYDSIYQSVLTTVGCGNGSSNSIQKTCDTCFTKLGTYSQYRINYLAGIGEPSTVTSFDTQIRSQYIVDSLDCKDLCDNRIPASESSLASLRRDMLQDMVPYTGQYAINPYDNSGNRILDSTKTESKFNIFSPNYNISGSVLNTYNGVQKPLFRNPQHPILGNFYFTDDNKKDENIHPSTGSAILPSILSDDFSNLFTESWATSLIQYHPEYTKLVYAENNLKTTYEYYDKLVACTSYAQANNNNLLDILNNDPFFVLNSSQKNHMDSLLRGGVTKTSGGIYAGPSIYQLANASVLCRASSSDACIYSMPEKSIATSIQNSTFVDDKNDYWEALVTNYFSYRNNLVVNYLNSQTGMLAAVEADSLVSQGKKLHFVTTTTLAAQNGYTFYSNFVNNPNPTSGDSTTISNAANNHPYAAGIDVCNGQRVMWRANLLQCDSLRNMADTSLQRTIINTILDSMVLVCKNSKDANNEYGASNVPPTFIGQPRSFEQVINAVFASYGLTSANGRYFCNPYSIVYPKPFGKNKPIYSKKIDKMSMSCGGLETFLSMKSSSQVIGANSSALDSFNRYSYPLTNVVLTLQQWNALNFALGCDACTFPEPVEIPDIYNGCPLPTRCITCTEFDSLTNLFKQTFPQYNNIPHFGSSLSSTQFEENELWARFLNYKTGFGFNQSKYLETYTLCNIEATFNNYALCDTIKPITDKSNFPQPIVNDTCSNVKYQSLSLAINIFEKRKEYYAARFDSLYLAKCLQAQQTEVFYALFQPKEYHYTLYYYNQSGNLAKTTPPNAVKPNFSTSFLDSVAVARDSNLHLPNYRNNENLTTQYCYNSLNQVVAQRTPDAGVSKFWYDVLGRLVVSQNAQQLAINKFSYTLYDALGRITQVGQKPQSQPITNSISKNSDSLSSWLAGGSLKEQITRTVYDVSYYNGDNILALSSSTTQPPILVQRNLRNRVSYSQVINIEPIGGNYTGAHQAATFYSYDIHGNVDTLLQDFGSSSQGANALNKSTNNRFKKIVYSYDLISGKVNEVAYQPNYKDQYYHRYSYDAENKLTSVATSHDGIYWEQNQASYTYYRHGPLARTELGTNKVQGLDYAYTIQGWLKGVNTTFISESQVSCTGNSAQTILNVNNRYTNNKPIEYLAQKEINFLDGFQSSDVDDFVTKLDSIAPNCIDSIIASPYTYGDIGEDGISGSSMPLNIVARDVFGFSLNYFNNDYQAISGNTPFNTNTLPLANNIANPLFNGNIAAMVVNVPKLGMPMVYGYRYDQLNRIKSMNAFEATPNPNNNNLFTLNATNNYKERVTYDPNGNILTYNRNSIAQRPGHMDSMQYHYVANTNKLNKVVDNANDVVNSEYSKYNDIKRGQGNNNYQYDAIGNLISDASEGISQINWTVYGKIQSIQKTGGVNIHYTYDASGNRISKIVASPTADTLATYYVRDASGNVMSVYSSAFPLSGGALVVTQKELHLYGSSRLGLYNANRDVTNNSPQNAAIYYSSYQRGNVFFELSNHLGNVLAVITDRKIGVRDSTYSTGGIMYDLKYFTAEVVSATDYYPFGMTMPGRNYNAGSGYRFGFNGQERSTEINDNSFTAEFWQYDSRIGRRWNVDPVFKEYESPYASLGNNPIWFMDPNGLDTVKSRNDGMPGDVFNSKGEWLTLSENCSWFNKDGVAFSFTTKKQLNNSSQKRKLGDLSEEWESSGKGPGFISSGKGDNGGQSYGIWQLASKVKGELNITASANLFAKSEYNPWKNKFEGLQAGTSSFNSVWRKIAKEDPNKFREAQYLFQYNHFFLPTVKRLEQKVKINVLTHTFILQDVVWSTATQFGSAYVIINALKGKIAPNMTDEELIIAIYSERGREGKNNKLAYFQSSEVNWSVGIRKRYKKELHRALKELKLEINN